MRQERQRIADLLPVEGLVLQKEEMRGGWPERLCCGAEQKAQIGGRDGHVRAEQAEVEIQFLAAEKTRDAERTMKLDAEAEQRDGAALPVFTEDKQRFDPAAGADRLEPGDQKSPRLIGRDRGDRFEFRPGGRHRRRIEMDLDINDGCAWGRALPCSLRRNAAPRREQRGIIRHRCHYAADPSLKPETGIKSFSNERSTRPCQDEERLREEARFARR